MFLDFLLLHSSPLWWKDIFFLVLVLEGLVGHHWNIQLISAVLFFWDMWSNRQIWPWNAEWSRGKTRDHFLGDWTAKVGSQDISGVTGKFGLGVQNEAEQRLTEFCQENALVIVNTLFQKHKRRLYTWTSPDGQHRNQIDYILCSQRWRSSIQLTRTRPGVDCGSDHELLFTKFRLKLKKVGKTARTFRYDVNQIPYDYTVDVRNRFKGLDLRDRVPDELWNEVRDIV